MQMRKCANVKKCKCEIVQMCKYKNEKITLIKVIKNNMKKGFEKFNFYLVQLEKLLVAAAKSKNAALYLYENDCRTKVFMLQGLSKLYANMHNEKRFTKTKDAFKAIEDLLGAIDYYDNFYKDFLADKNIPEAIQKATLSKKVQSIADLNFLLEDKKWINSDKPKVEKIRKKLEKLDWQEEEKEIEGIKKVYEKSIASINKFYKETGTSFTDLETQIHEIRRKLRWLSIYPQALQGSIQYLSKIKADAKIKKYLTKEIVTSKYNVMPAVGNRTCILPIEKNYFLALSFVINALGNLKDKGLRIMAIAEAIEHTEFIKPELALAKALKISKQNPTAIKTILKEAKVICKQFFEEDNLGKLLGK